MNFFILLVYWFFIIIFVFGFCGINVGVGGFILIFIKKLGLFSFWIFDDFF